MAPGLFRNDSGITFQVGDQTGSTAISTQSHEPGLLEAAGAKSSSSLYSAQRIGTKRFLRSLGNFTIAAFQTDKMMQQNGIRR